MNKYIILYIYIITCWLSLSVSVSSKIVIQGDYVGGDALSNEIKSLHLSDPDSIRIYFINQGYLDARVQIENDNIIITPMNRYKLSNVYVKTDSSYVLNYCLPFESDIVEGIINNILELSYSEGYYYSSCIIDSVAAIDQNIDIHLFLDKGPRIILKDNILIGLNRTKPDLINKYLLNLSDRLLTGQTIEEAEEAAEEITFVDFQPPLIIKPKPGYTEADFEYRFREINQVYIEGGLGYLPDNSSKFLWSLDLGFYNIFGSGKQMSLLTERRYEGRQILDLSYKQPFFLVGNGTLGINVATRDYRDQFYEFSLRGEYAINYRNELNIGIDLGWRNVKQSDNQLPDYSIFSTAFKINRTGLDNKYNAISGYIINWQIEYSYRLYDNDSVIIKSDHNSYNETRNELELGWYKRISDSWVNHLALKYNGFETGEKLPPLSELYLIGGPGSVRGFRNEQFPALRYAVVTIEPHFLFAGGYLFAFYDGAYINNRVKNNLDEVVTDEFYRWGYGFGLTVVNDRRSVKISLGWNRELSFDQPRLSVEVTSEI